MKIDEFEELIYYYRIELETEYGETTTRETKILNELISELNSEEESEFQANEKDLFQKIQDARKFVIEYKSQDEELKQIILTIEASQSTSDQIHRLGDIIF